MENGIPALTSPNLSHWRNIIMTYMIGNFLPSSVPSRLGAITFMAPPSQSKSSPTTKTSPSSTPPNVSIVIKLAGFWTLWISTSTSSMSLDHTLPAPMPFYDSQISSLPLTMITMTSLSSLLLFLSMLLILPSPHALPLPHPPIPLPSKLSNPWMVLSLLPFALISLTGNRSTVSSPLRVTSTFLPTWTSVAPSFIDAMITPPLVTLDILKYANLSLPSFGGQV